MAAKDGSIRWFDDWHDFLKSDAAQDIAATFRKELDGIDKGVPQERVEPKQEPQLIEGPVVDYTDYSMDATHTPYGSVLLLLNLPEEDAKGLVSAWQAYNNGNGQAGAVLDAFVDQIAETVAGARQP